MRAVQECTVAGAIAAWFFLPKGQGLSSPITKAYWRSIRCGASRGAPFSFFDRSLTPRVCRFWPQPRQCSRPSPPIPTPPPPHLSPCSYHLGSLAFGAFIIAVVQMMRIILAYIQKKTKGRMGAVADIILRCCALCLWCMEKCLKFLNRNAYIEIAIYGFSFCKAARTAFSLLIRNALRVAVINSIGDLVIFLSRLVVVAITGFGALVWFRDMSKKDVEYPAVPAILVCIVAYLISGIFMGIYEVRGGGGGGGGENRD